jgi:nitrous oxidase accessory protein
MGLFLEHSQTNVFRNNVVSGNHIGIHITNSSDANVFTGNTFTGNLHPVETSGTNAANVWATDGRGNYWDTATRLDLDADGIGDIPHRELDLFGEWRRSFPAIGLLAGSPGERLLRFIHARVVMPGLPGISDPAPLIVAPR